MIVTVENSREGVEMQKIKMTKGKYVIVDDGDYENLKALGQWQPSQSGNTFYAIMSKHLGGKTKGGYDRKTTVRMHRVIMGDIPKGLVVDHINRNGLDNRRANLRIVSKNQNQWNRSVTKGRKYKGVSKQARYNGFIANITCDGVEHYLGAYETEEDAALAYNIKAKELFGEHAMLNKVRINKVVPAKYVPQWNELKKKIKCVETNAIFKSVNECAEKLNINRTSISSVLTGRRMTAGGKTFIYL